MAKQEGDKVSKGDKLAEIETDKTVVEMESYNDGFLTKITADEGSKVQVGKNYWLCWRRKKMKKYLKK